MQEAHCNYYGSLADNRKGFSLGETLLDEMYRKVLAKHEGILVKNQEAMISELRRTFSKDIKEFKSSLKSIDERIRKLERFVKKEKENAISEGS
jgi:ribosome recycling factor